MHKLTIQQCAEYLHAAYAVVGARLIDCTGLKIQVDYKQAPDNFADLQRDAKELGVVFISDEHSEHSIYGVAGNTAFRIMHDLGHLTTGLTFSATDEVALALHQWEEIRLLIPSDWRERCQAVYQADTIMQTLYHARHGQFVANQSEFIEQALVAYN